MNNSELRTIWFTCYLCSTDYQRTRPRESPVSWLAGCFASSPLSSGLALLIV